MSIRGENTPEFLITAQYETIKDALATPGKRLACKKQGEGYVFREILRGEKTKPGESADLTTVTKAIETFIEKTGGIDESQKNILLAALLTRVKSLQTGRFVPFWKAEARDTAVTQLGKVREVIENAKIRETTVKTHAVSQEVLGAQDLERTGQTASTGRVPSPFAQQSLPTEEVIANPSDIQNFDQTFGSFAPPPPPPFGLTLAPPKFAGELDEPKDFRPTVDRKKTPEDLKKEINEITTYVEAMDKALEPIRSAVMRAEELTGEIAAQTKNYYDPGRANLEALQKQMDPLVELWNGGKGGELPIGDKGGSMRMYTDKDYEQELKHRKSDTKFKKTYDQNLPITIANKLSFTTLIAYSEIREQAALVGKKGEKVFKLVDQNGDEIIPIEVEQKGVNISIKPKSLTGKYVLFENAKGPLTLVEEVLKEDGTLTKEIEKLKKEKEKIESMKSGGIEFKDFSAKLNIKQNRLNIWKNAISNREKAMKSTAVVIKEAVISLWTLITKKREHLELWASKWKLVDDKFKQNIQLSPKATLLDALCKAPVKKD